MYRDTMKWLMRGAVRYYLCLDSEARKDPEARKDELAICRESGMYAEELARKAAEFLEKLEKEPPRGRVETFALLSRVGDEP